MNECEFELYIVAACIPLIMFPTAVRWWSSKCDGYTEIHVHKDEIDPKSLYILLLSALMLTGNVMTCAITF